MTEQSGPLTDCHAHVFDPARFPYAPDRRYTPPSATASALRELHQRLGVTRAVLVQPSVYGSDNSCLVDALRQLGPQARGVAVLADAVADSELEDLHAAGVRGARLNLHVERGNDLDAARRRLVALSDRIGARPWVVQLHAALPVILGLGDTLRALRQQVVIDHFALAPSAQGTSTPAFEALLSLLQATNIHIKLSGPYQISAADPDFADVTPLAQALMAAAPGRCVWGTDWPHPAGSRRRPDVQPGQVEEFLPINDHQLLDLLPLWAPQLEVRHRLLTDNPAHLFGF